MRVSPAPLFSAAILVSAGLLFCLEPMVGKMLLAPLGGAPAVWNACMLFFQVVLLAGYLYSHVLVTKLGTKHQAVVHLALVALPWIVLPVAIRVTNVTDPTVTTLVALGRSVGLPFFVLSTSAPLLQRWFSATKHPTANDPYSLYAASNFGSMVALLGYPFVIEPALGLRAQGRWWEAGYGLFAALLVGCVVVLLRSHARAPAATEPAVPATPITNRDRARWLFYSFVPASLLLGVTQHVTTNIAALPLFWVVPLALYLATFMLVFARRRLVPHRVMTRLLPFFATVTLIMLTAEATEPRWLIAITHVATAFVAFMVCHGELVATRPEPSKLTEFYLFMSLGGVLGGVFNALIAPHLFTTLLEYPLAVVAACFARPRTNEAAPNETRERRLDRIVPGLLFAFSLGVALVSRGRTLPVAFKYLLAPAFLLNYRWIERRGRFAAGLLAIVVGAAFYPDSLGRTIDRERTFFGVVRVAYDDTGTILQIMHGHTVHGAQTVTSDPERRNEPLSYYHPTGPAGDVFREADRHGPSSRVALVGLGAGALFHYARAGDEWTAYEINPAVVRMAKEHFTFIRDAKCGMDHIRFEIGDARIRLALAPPSSFDVIVIDAFSSDAIPIHLLTREALAIYMDKLAPKGLLAMHISNHFIDLVGPIDALVKDAQLVARHRQDDDLSPELARRGKLPSKWVVIARDDAALGALADDPRWSVLRPRKPSRVWTDDDSNLLSALAW